MKKKTKFPLILKDDYQAKSLEELQDHFDYKKILNYYKKGQLQQWLQDRYYEAEYDKIVQLDASSDKFGEELCSILGVEYAENMKEEQTEVCSVKDEPESSIQDHIEVQNVKESHPLKQLPASLPHHQPNEEAFKSLEDSEQKLNESMNQDALKEIEQKDRLTPAHKTNDVPKGKEATEFPNSKTPTKQYRENPKQQAIFSLIFACIACCCIAAWPAIGAITVAIIFAIFSLILGHQGQRSELQTVSTIGIVLSSLVILLFWLQYFITSKSLS